MGFRYIDEIASKENLAKFLEFVDLAIGSGQDVNNAFDLSEKFHDTRPMELCIEAIKQDPASAAMLKEKYVGEPYNLEAMLKMPKYSLGWTYARILQTLDLDANFYRTPKTFNSEAEYITYRVFRTHDIHHILTGFSLDVFGESGVISLSVAQFHYPGFLFIDLTSLLMRFIASPSLYSESLEKTEQVKTLGYGFKVIQMGIEMGESAKKLFPIKFEEHLERPLDDIRQELNIIPVTEGPYSWYSDPALKAAIA
jgi:ubiquinone biosynthesis protein Coq4